MPATLNLEAANNGGFLWPSVSDALDTFLRRRHNDADPYERVWRLIHLWEATEITLALAAMSRLAEDGSNPAILRRQREFFYGKTWNEVTGSFKSMQGAADGAVDQWINILDEIAKAADLSGRFLGALKGFLTASEIDMGPLLTSWAKACDVPPDYKRTAPVEVRMAMRYVNSFRNRLAHVPFPHDPLGDVADGLEAATEQLFSVSPVPTAHEKNGQSSALTGAFRIGRCFLHGGHMESLSESSSKDIQFVFPCRKRGEETEAWLALPMLHVDTMMRPHILTRVKGHDVCEYTRFRAEANAVVVRDNSGITQRLPEPIKADYVSIEETPPKPAPVVEGGLEAAVAPASEMSMSDAIEAIRSEDYDSAISYFDKLTRERPTYHIGWLRLGYARREKAVRLVPGDRDEAVRLLRLAVDDLAKAAQHIDRQYQAVAWYECSKSYYHLVKLVPEDEQSRTMCKEDAERACALSDEKKFLTWWEHVQTWLEGTRDIDAQREMRRARRNPTATPADHFAGPSTE
jgi:tetratricopeptide (TPR) repeat protein